MNEQCDRRDFLRTSLLGAGALSLGPGLLCARRAPASEPFVADAEVLVVIELGGGNDGLNMVVPFGDDEYHKARPTLRVKPEQCLRLTEVLGLNGQLEGVKQLYDKGVLAVIQAVGYPNPNRSHFKSMDIWQSADPSEAPKTSGWLGRLADLCCKQQPDPEFAVNLSVKTPLALRGTNVRPISFQNPAAYKFAGSKNEMKAFERIADDVKANRNDVLSLLGKTAESARESSDEIRKATAEYRTTISYPGSPLGQSLRTVAALLHARLPTRVYYAYHSGFDTHVQQIARQDRLLQDLDAALAAFQADLERLGLARRVTTMMFSEFGRRVHENASRGTDHGTAAPMFVLGGRVKGGLYGKTPSLTDLDKGDLKFNVDFRAIYATLLEDHMRVGADRVLGAKFDRLPLFV